MRSVLCLSLIGAAAAARSTDDLPVITAAGWTIYNGPAACPGGTTPCIELTVAGDNFGASQGQLQKGDFLAPPAPPPPQPWDTPAVLFPSDLATRVGGNGVCVARSLYTGDGFAYRFCPFQRVEHFLGNFANGNLGTYAGVVRDFNNVNCPGSNAIVGMKFLDGSMCNGAPSTSIVNFVCVDVLGAGLVDWGTRTPMIDSAVTPDQCNWNLTLPLPGACDGPRFALCGSAVASPNPTPAPSPQFSFAPATPLSWTAGLITALMPGTVPPPAVRIETSAGVLSTAVEPEAGTLPPSASPIPVPFPSTLEIISMTPQEGVRGACNPVVIQLAGVVLSDIVSQFNVVFRVRVPTGPNSAMNYNFQGIPGPVNGRQPVAPPNGLLNLTLQCLNTPSNWPSFPQEVQLTAGFFWTQASLGTHLIRSASCQTPGCLAWTFLPAPGDVDGVPAPGTLDTRTGDIDASAETPAAVA